MENFKQECHSFNKEQWQAYEKGLYGQDFNKIQDSETKAFLDAFFELNPEGMATVDNPASGQFDIILDGHRTFRHNLAKSKNGLIDVWNPKEGKQTISNYQDLITYLKNHK